MRRVFVAMMAVCCAALALAVSAHAADRFAREMTLGAAFPGFRDLVLDEPLTPWPESGQQATFSFEGEGWIKQAYLRGMDPTPSGLYVWMWWFRAEGESALGPYSLDFAFLFNSDHLPAGRYRWYLWTNDGRQGTARMGWPTRSGSLHAPPAVRLPMDERPLAVNTLGTLSWFGATGDLASEGAAFLRLATDAPAPSADRLETCTYADGDGGRPDAYMPNCPGGEGYATTSVPYKGEDFVAVWNGFGGKLGVGGNLTVGGLPPQYDARAAWLPFEPVGPPVSAGPAPPPVTPAGPTVVSTGTNVQTRADSPTAGRASLAAARARVRRGRARLKLRCSDAGACAGQVRIGSASSRGFDLAAGAERSVSVPVTRRIARALRRRRSVLARVLLVTRTDSSLQRESRRIRLTR